MISGDRSKLDWIGLVKEALTALGPARIAEIADWAVRHRAMSNILLDVRSSEMFWGAAEEACFQLSGRGAVCSFEVGVWELSSPPSQAEFDRARGLKPVAKYDLEEREDRAREYAQAHLLRMMERAGGSVRQSMERRKSDRSNSRA